MRTLRWAAVIAALVLLTSVVAVSAEGAWILWSQITTQSWEPLGGFPDEGRCRANLQIAARWLRDYALEHKHQRPAALRERLPGKPMKKVTERERRAFRLVGVLAHRALARLLCMRSAPFASCYLRLHGEHHPVQGMREEGWASLPRVRKLPELRSLEDLPSLKEVAPVLSSPLK
jgi:hypothetical protein